MAGVFTLPEAQEQFIDIVRRLENKSLLPQLLEWIHWNWKTDFESKTSFEAAEEMLTDIACDLRSILPTEGILQTENFRTPSTQEKPDYDSKHTVHVDAFLYDDELVDNLCEEGKLARSYCLECGSCNTKPLTYISHSLPKEQLAYIFRAILPPLDGKVVLDVGSRLGAVLYGAYLYSSAAKIVGVEINSDFCSLQREVVKKYKLQDRIEVVEANIMDRPDIVRAADVIVMNNVFEFFMDIQQQSIMWRFMRETVQPGTLLVTNPPLEQALHPLHTGIDIRTWVEELPLYNADAAGVRITAEDAQELKHYRILAVT